MGGMGVLGAMGVFGSACPNRLTAPKPLCSPPPPCAATRPLPPLCLSRAALAALLCNLCYLCYLCYLCERRPAALLPPCRPFAAAAAAPCRRPSPPLKLLSGAPRPGGAKKTSVSLHPEIPDTRGVGRPFAVARATFSAAFSAMRRPYPPPAPHKKQ